MPKQLKAHWIVRGVAVSLATLGIAVGWQASSGVDRTLGNPRVLEQSDFGWRQGELLFLKAALNRLDADAKQTDLDSPALRSLRAEQDAVMLRMREVAWPVPAESLPRELRLLAKDEQLAAVETTLLAALDIATGGAAGLAGYSATKGGVRLFAKAVAMECASVGDRIRVNSVHPGIIDTPIWGKIPTEAAGSGRNAPIDPEERAKAVTPLARAGHASEIASGVLYLASDASAYVTGTELVIDGGMNAGVVPRKA